LTHARRPSPPSAKSPGLRAALRLLADYPAGCPAGLILLRGFCAVDMIVLIMKGWHVRTTGARRGMSERSIYRR
jgi:hypothetical protein